MLYYAEDLFYSFYTFWFYCIVAKGWREMRSKNYSQSPHTSSVVWCNSRWLFRLWYSADHQSHEQLICPGYPKCWRDSVIHYTIKEALEISACMNLIWNILTSIVQKLHWKKWSTLSVGLQRQRLQGILTKLYTRFSLQQGESWQRSAFIQNNSVILPTAAMVNPCLHLDGSPLVT